MKEFRIFTVGMFALGLAGCVAAGGSSPAPKATAGEPAEIAAGQAGIAAPPLFKGAAYRGLTQHTYSEVGEDFDVSVSPDGKTILFSSTQHSENPQIYTKPVGGTAVSVLISDPAQNMHPRFSPDGKRIIYASDRNGNWDLFVTTLDGREASWQVTKSVADEIHPTWSPDGKRIAYCSWDDVYQEWRIWVMDLENHIQTDIGAGLFPVWSPKGDRIAFQKARQRGEHWYSIWTMDLEGNRLTEVIASREWAAINPAWSADGSKIAFATVHQSPASKKEKRIWKGDDIWVVDGNGANLIRLTTTAEPEWGPTWAPDGRIFFSSTRGGRQNIWSVSPIGMELLAGR
ncbi:MAG: hypothetical protein V1809_01325 [Planctomycetota bacterium]